MSLTTEQLATLKTALLAETDPTVVAAVQGGGTFALAQWLNAEASPAHSVWRTNAKVADILDAVNWAQYTPSDTVDGTATFTNRLLSIQTKQMNLQNMTVGRDTVDASKANIRLGLRDAVTGVPAGAGGATVNPGGSNGSTVLNACVRNATRGEKVFATVQATTGAVSAYLLTYEGSISSDDVGRALTS